MRTFDLHKKNPDPDLDPTYFLPHNFYLLLFTFDIKVSLIDILILYYHIGY